MEHKQKVTTRRGALGRILGVAFGAAGVGAFAGARATDAATPRLPANLTLYAPALRLKKVGERSLPSGGLVDVRERHVGALHTALVDSTAGALTLQTFQLEDGTLQGLGSNGSYVLLGGTGQYAGVIGSYLDRPATRRHGREFVFTFREATHGN